MAAMYQRRAPLPVFEEKSPPDSIMYTDVFKATPLTSRTFSTGGSITQSFLPTVISTSTGLRISGTRPKLILHLWEINKVLSITHKVFLLP